MQRYEIAILAKPLLPEDIKEKVMPLISEAITKLGGKSEEIKDDWGKKHLAYPIQGHEEGYYFFFDAELEPASVAKLEKSMKLMRDILRFLVIKEELV